MRCAVATPTWFVTCSPGLKGLLQPQGKESIYRSVHGGSSSGEHSISILPGTHAIRDSCTVLHPSFRPAGLAARAALTRPPLHTLCGLRQQHWQQASAPRRHRPSPRTHSSTSSLQQRCMIQHARQSRPRVCCAVAGISPAPDFHNRAFTTKFSCLNNRLHSHWCPSTLRTPHVAHATNSFMLNLHPS